MSMFNFHTCIIVVFFVCIGCKLYGQDLSKFELNLKLDAYCIPFNNPTTDIRNPKFYTDWNLNRTSAGYVGINWWAIRSFGMRFGAGIHGFGYSAGFRIPDPGGPAYAPLLEVHREWNVLGIGPEVKLMFRKNRLSIEAGVTFFDLVQIKSDDDLNYLLTIYFNPDTHVPYTFIAEETLEPIQTSVAYTLWQFNFEYEFTENLYVCIGIESLLNSTSLTHYNVRLTEYYNLKVEEAEIVNDFKFGINYDAFSIGLVYKFGFGSY